MEVLRKVLLFLLPIAALVMLAGLVLGSGIAEGATRSSFIVYMLVMSAILVAEFILLWQQVKVKLFVLLSSLTVLFLLVDLWSDTFIESLISG